MRRRILIFVVFLSGMLLFSSAVFAASGLSGMAKITDIQIAESENALEIVVNADRNLTFKTSALSRRIIVDIQNAWLAPDVKRAVDLDSPFARRCRIAQFNKKTVRVVVETDAKKDGYEIAALPDASERGAIILRFGAKQEGKQTVREAAEEKLPLDPGIEGKRITLDAGHGGIDPGAIGPTGLTEKSVTLRIAKELKTILEEEGATVYMTRTEDAEVSPKGEDATDVEELQARCDVANQSQSDLFVSIHIDAYTKPEPHGTTSFYYRRGTKHSRTFAEDVGKGVVRRLGTFNRGAKGCNFYVVRHTDMIATLVEVAFISNPAEEKLMKSDKGVKLAAQGIADGIREFL